MSKLIQLHLVSATALLMTAGSVQAQVFFSVANDGPGGLAGDLIFEGNPSIIAGGGVGSGLGQAGDDINGFNRRESFTAFLLCLSVDRFSVGSLDPVQGFGLPEFNVKSEAAINRQAGNAYLTTEAFDRNARLPGVSMGLFNNVMAINESDTAVAPYDDPNRNFGLLPQTVPGGPVFADTNDVDGGSPPIPSGDDIFFTMTAASPSLVTLAGGGGNGATIFSDFTPFGPGGNETVYSSSADLGLTASDDIDALVVFDDDLDSVFSQGDQVFFSLAPGSQTLADLGRSAADVFTIRWGESIELFAAFDDMGLLFGDNLNMLAFTELNGTALNTINTKITPTPGTVTLALIALAAKSRRRRPHANRVGL